ncbi:hypothetical protein J6X90_01990 [Candidatus Saccharibacteria bacterium]|nr:hypothetical protein [Candidatus Saccharibacteria bacterium]
MDSTADDWFLGDDDGDKISSGLSEFQDNVSGWGNRMMEKARENRQDGAKSLGRFAEDSATKTGSAAGSNGVGNSAFMTAVQNAKDAEGRGGFANNVKGKTLENAAAAAVPGGKKIMAQAKKFGPLGTILAIVTILVGVFSGAQTLAPFGLVANGLDQFNNLRTSMNRRNTYFRRFSLDDTRNTPLTKKATIFSAENFKISNSMSSKLSKQKIYYVDGSPRFLVYEDNDTGKKYAVAANDDDVGRLPNSADIEIDGETVTVEFDQKMKIDDALLDSDNFSKSLDVGTRTLKGHIAGWFDGLSDYFHKFRIKSSRNKFKDAPDDADEDDIKTRAYDTDEGMDENIRASNSDAEEDRGRTEVNDDGEEEWKPSYESVDDDQGVDKSSTRGQNPADVQERVRSDFELKARNVVAGIGQGANLACTALKVYAAFNAIIAGIQVANIVNYVTGFLEAIDKTKSGDAGKSELAFYMNSLSEKGDTYGSSLSSDTTGDYNKPIKSGTSSLQSDAWNQFFSSGSVVVQPNDPVALKFNREYTALQSTNNLLGVNGGDGRVAGAITALVASVGSSAAAYKHCLYIDATANIVELAADGAIDIILAVFTGGIGNVIKQVFKEIAEKIWRAVALGLIVTAVTSIFMSFIPQIAQWMAMDLIGNMAGEDAAYAINSGFNIYLGGQMQVGSGLPATEAKLMAHWRAQQEVIAEEGAFERSTKSPFDPTSKYTFVGSLINSLIPVASTWSSPLTTISKTAGMVGTAFMNLRPTAAAEGEARFETSLNHDCPNLSKIGAIGDAYCNPYFVTDMSTMGVDPSDVIDAVSYDTEKSDDPENGNFLWNDERGEVDTDGDGVADAYNPPINPEGELAKWVISCSTRDSGFGIVDSNVMNSITQLKLTGNKALDDAVKTGMSWIPIVGDIDQIKDDFKQAAQFEWATGKNCLDEEYKYYSRYAEDQRMLESMGLINESAVVAFLNEYQGEHTVDNSKEGIIARYSGLTKTEVEETLAYIDAFEWLAEYNPADAGPEKPLPKLDDYQYESNAIIAEAEKAVVGDYIVFDDLRTKTKVA